MPPLSESGTEGVERASLIIAMLANGNTAVRKQAVKAVIRAVAAEERETQYREVLRNLAAHQDPEYVRERALRALEEI